MSEREAKTGTLRAKLEAQKFLFYWAIFTQIEPANLTFSTSRQYLSLHKRQPREDRDTLHSVASVFLFNCRITRNSLVLCDLIPNDNCVLGLINLYRASEKEQSGAIVKQENI